ncbi:MAG: hypothetical protein KBE09_05735 [Candidatus Pacebacteria bacterium]|nr:hypothetical protein [Candidatus Paceibacterota bacterium]
MDTSSEAELVRRAFVHPEARATLKELLHPLVDEKAAEYRAKWNALSILHSDFVQAGLQEFDWVFNLYLKNMNDPAVTPFSKYYTWFMRQAMRKLVDPTHTWPRTLDPEDYSADSSVGGN